MLRWGGDGERISPICGYKREGISMLHRGGGAMGTGKYTII